MKKKVALGLCLQIVVCIVHTGDVKRGHRGLLTYLLFSTNPPQSHQTNMSGKNCVLAMQT